MIFIKKLVLFDWGNVLFNSHSTSNIHDARKYIVEEISPQDVEMLMKIFDDDRFWTMSGQYLNKLIEEYLVNSCCNCTVDEFKKCYLKHYSKIPWYQDMIFLVNTLLADDRFCVGIMSTLCEMDLALIKNNLPVDDFDYRFFSFNLGVQKPNEKIYDMVEMISGVSKDNILFIDDNENNIIEAKSKGWNTVLATGNDSEEIRQKCYSFIGIDQKLERFMDSMLLDVMMMDE